MVSRVHQVRWSATALRAFLTSMIVQSFFFDDDVIVGGDAGPAPSTDPAAHPQNLRPRTPIVPIESVFA